MPVKSCEQPKTQERRHLNIVQDVETPQQPKLPAYRDYKEFEMRIQKLKLSQNGWLIKISPNKTCFKFFQKPFIVPLFEVIVNESLEFTCAVYGKVLPADNMFYKTYRRSLRNVTISKLLADISNGKLCPGLDVESDEGEIHFILSELELDENGDHVQQTKQYSRSKDCLLLTIDAGKCTCCYNFEKNLKKSQSCKQVNINTPALLNAPLAYTHPNKVRLALQEERSKVTVLQKKDQENGK